MYNRFAGPSYGQGLQNRRDLLRTERVRNIHDGLQRQISSLQSVSNRLKSSLAQTEVSTTPYDTSSSGASGTTPATTTQAFVSVNSPNMAVTASAGQPYQIQVTINGGSPGQAANLQLWRADATYVATSLVVQIPVTLSGGPITTSLNASLLAGVNNFLVILVDSSSGGQLSTAPVPSITAGTSATPYPAPPLPGGTTLPGVTVNSATTTITPGATTTAVSVTVTGPANTPVVLRAFKGNTYGVKDTSTGNEQQLAASLTVTLTGYTATFTIPNVAVTPNVANIIVVTAADLNFIAETYPMLVTQIAAPAPPLPGGTTLPGVTVNSATTTITPGATTTAVSVTVTGPANTPVVLRAFKGNTYGVKDTSTGNEQQLAASLTVTLTGYTATFTIPNVAVTPNVANIIVVTAADLNFIAETYPMLVTQIAAPAPPLPGGTTLPGVTVNSATTTITPGATTTAVSVTVTGPANTPVVLRAFKGNTYGVKDTSTGNEQQLAASLTVTLTGYTATFTIPNVAVTPNVANIIVVTAADLNFIAETYPMLVTQIAAPAPPLPGGTTLPGVTVNSATTTITPGATTTAVSVTVTGPANTPVVLRAFKGNTYGVKDTSTGNEQQLAASLTVTLTGYTATFTIPNVAVTPNVANIIVVTAADLNFIAETYPMLVTQIAAPAQVTPPTVTELSEFVKTQHGRGFWIIGTSQPNSIVRLYRSFKDRYAEERHLEREVETDGANTFKAFAVVRPNIFNKFFLTAVVGGAESAAAVVPTIHHMREVIRKHGAKRAKAEIEEHEEKVLSTPVRRRQGT